MEILIKIRMKMEIQMKTKTKRDHESDVEQNIMKWRISSSLIV